jgi:tetratricopeptide (TPR) repeat protein
VIEDYLRRFPENREVELQGAFLYMMAGQFDEASQVLARLVAREPANVELLASLAVARMESGRHEDAIQTLTRALELSPTNYVARLNRAVARLRAGQLDFAKEDYLKLESTAPASIPVLFGLGEIAHRQAQTNAAIGYYRRYLSNSPTASAEAGYVRERLEQLGAKPQPLSPARAR